MLALETALIQKSLRSEIRILLRVSTLETLTKQVRRPMTTKVLTVIERGDC